jgi:Transglycosylase SLT domain
MSTPGQADPMGGVVAGGADLQSAIDRLDNDIRGLTTAVQGSGGSGGMSTSPAMAGSLAGQGVTFSGGTYAGAGGGSGFLGTNQYGGNNGSGGTSGTNPYSMGGGNLAQGVTNFATDAINGQFLSGSQQLNDQATINTYGYTQAGFWNVKAASAISTAFGGGSGSGLTMNNLATSASDARIGGTMLSQISGQANYTAGAPGTYGRGNAAFQLAATTGMANPGLGMAGSASVAGNWYNASTSYNLMMMGVNTTPLQLGTGKSQNMSSVEAAIGQRFGFQGYNSNNGTFNSQNLSANLDNPLFQMQIMQATGMSQQQYNVWSQQWGQMNNWAQTGHTTMNAMQNEVSQYMNGSAGQQKQAQSWLGAHGVSQSLLQSMTQAQAGQTAAEAGGNAGFTSGLQAATNMVGKFTAALAKGLQTMAGTSGFAGAIGSLNSSGVIGAGAGGIPATVVNALATGASTLGKDISSFGADLNLFANSNSGGGYGGGGNTGAGSGSAAQNQAMAQNIISVMPQYRGWNSGGEWQSLLALWNGESGWNNNAQNPTSTAYGIAQFLNSTWGGTGYSKSSDPSIQIKAGLKYISQRYGDPSSAWNFWKAQNPHWYADGTDSAASGVAVVGERGPEAIKLSGGQQILNAAQTAKMMQPSFSGPGAGSGGNGVYIIFQSGAIQMTTTGGNATAGYHTSSDVQASAQQLEQAIETVLRKNTTIRNIAAGVTG